MLNVRRYGANYALLALLVCSTSWAAPIPSQADDVARKALESRQYADVVKAYDGVERSSLSDQAFYRLAIAQQRLGNAQEAKKSLNLALGLNPKGSFASSPERLASLQKDIDKGLAALPIEPTTASPKTTSTVQTPLAPSFVPAVVSVDAVPRLEPAATAPALSDTVSMPSVPPATEPQRTIQTPKAAPGESISPGADTASSVTVVLFWVVLCLLFALAGVSFVMWKILRNLRAATADNRALATLMKKRIDELTVIYSRPASEVRGLVALRDEVVKMRALVAAAERQDSALSKLLDKLEPLVEAEIGRNLFRKSRKPLDLSPADQEMLELVQLESAAMTLEGAEPEAVMRHLVGGHERFKKLIGPVVVNADAGGEPTGHIYDVR